MKKRMLALLLGLLCAGLTACGSTDTAAKDETPSAPTVEQPEPCLLYTSNLSWFLRLVNYFNKFCMVYWFFTSFLCTLSSF